MATRLNLPTDEKSLDKAIRLLVAKGESPRNRRMVGWMVAHHYLQGIRDFSNPDWQSGTLTINLGRTNADGYKDFRYEEVVSKYQTEYGRMLKVDITPKAIRKGEGLDSLRNASVAQIVMDDLVPTDVANEIKQKVLPLALGMGTFGLVAWKDEFGRPQMEVVPPWELLPLPSNATSLVDIQGKIRVRKVPLEWLKKKFTVSDDLATRMKTEKIETEEVEVGSAPIGKDNPVTGQGMVQFTELNKDSKDDKGGKLDLTEEYVTLAEIWQEAPGQRLHRYIVWAGGVTVHDARHYEQAGKKKLPAMPIAVGHYLNTGTFYGRAFVELLIPLNQEIEALLSRLFENIQELDLFGVMMIPSTLGIDIKKLSGRGRPKFLQYEPDYTAQFDVKPYQLTPTNTGPLPGKIVDSVLGLMDRLAQQSSMLMGDAPGRVDSARGLGFLFETASTPIAGPSLSLASALEVVYGAMLEMARDEWSDMEVAALSLMDDSVAGIVIDPTSGKLDSEKNSVPYKDQLTLTIRSAMPESPEQMKSELDHALGKQIITLRDYGILSRTKGLNLPVGNEVEWQNHRTAVLENLLLFGNGQEPGTILIRPDDLHAEHLLTLDAFMARPEFRWASDKVREQFDKHRAEHRAGMGSYPEQMAYPEELAEQEDTMGIPGMPPPPGMKGMSPPGESEGPPPPPPQGA